MNPTDAIEAILAAPDTQQSARIFRSQHAIAGFAQAYFDRLLRAFAEDHDAAARLASHWRLLLKYGDDPALAYRTKGVADRFAGRWLDSAKAFLTAAKLADDARRRLSFAVGAIDSYARAGRTSDAVALGKRLAKGLMELGETGQAGRVRLNVGNALLWVDRYRDARLWLREAVVALEDAGFAHESIYARVGLSTAELYGGSPIEAQRQAEKALADAREAAIEHTSAMCELNLAQAALMQGRADESLEILLRVRPRFASSSADTARLNEFLGDAYLRLNLWSEAIDAYREALRARRAMPAGNVAATLLGIGQAYFAAEDTSQAVPSLRAASRGFRRIGNDPWAAAADTALARAIAADGSVRRARRLAGTAAELARRSRSTWHEAEALLALAECSGPECAGHLRRAARLVEGNGYRSLRWRVRALQTQIAHPRSKLSGYRSTFDAIVEDRLLTSSPVSRAAYVRDKSRFISAYLAELLAKPTPDRVREAVEVVSRSRSAALIDEILAMAPEGLQSVQIEELQTLRMELQSLETEMRRPDGSRRGALSSDRIQALQRRWIEATHRLTTPLGAAPSNRNDSTVLIATADHVHALRHGSAGRVPIREADLDRLLRWTRFELLGPMAQRNADPGPALELLEDLACRILAPWLDPSERLVAICPDDHLWQAPWTACLGILSQEAEIVLALHPNLTKIFSSPLTPKSKTALWIDRAQDLYHAGVEEDSFLQSFPNALVCRSAAEARACLEEQVDLLHVICHAKHNSANPMFSSLDFGDGSIYAAEIARSGFRPKLVSLSACETGSVSAALRNEPDGLARAFLARGAETVIGSLWPLDDEAASIMYSVIFTHMLGGARLPDAIGHARRAVRSWNEHPYFWGSLALFGGYG